ncbi:hypothetical protein [Nocardia australiensis]|uniref:hypothetical protein n=1 Tax=Nocardia australiensis TaxID=2887191 RepID=UPI001D149FE4|nr:hypothetical protein [Nocardia australiensis]
MASSGPINLTPEAVEVPPPITARNSAIPCGFHRATTASTSGVNGATAPESDWGTTEPTPRGPAPAPEVAESSLPTATLAPVETELARGCLAPPSAIAESSPGTSALTLPDALGIDCCAEPSLGGAVFAADGTETWPSGAEFRLGVVGFEAGGVGVTLG